MPVATASTVTAAFLIVLFLALVFTWPILFAASNLRDKEVSLVAVIYSDKCQHSRKAREKLKSIPWLHWVNIQHIPTIGVPSADAKFSSELFASRKRITAGTQSAALQAAYVAFLKKHFHFKQTTPHFCLIKDGVVKGTSTGFPCSWYR